MKTVIAAVYCEYELQAASYECGYCECAQNKTSSIRLDWGLRASLYL